MLWDGHSMRSVARQTGVNKTTVWRLRTYIDEAVADAAYDPTLGISTPKCPCGQDSRHRGWCSWRFSKSKARKAFMREWHRQ